jgi:uncharacterized protein YoxC
MNTKLLEQRICTKNGIRYIKDNKYYIDCMAPTKIYRFIYDIKEVKNVDDEIKRNEKLINGKFAETKELITKLRKIYDNPQEIKKINEIRDRLSDLDIHIILHKTNIQGLKNKKFVIKIADKPSEMKVIQRKKLDQKPEDITSAEIKENAKEIEESVAEIEESVAEIEESVAEIEEKIEEKVKKTKKGGAKYKDYLDDIILEEYEQTIPEKLISRYDIPFGEYKPSPNDEQPFADDSDYLFELAEDFEDKMYNKNTFSTEERMEFFAPYSGEI